MRIPGNKSKVPGDWELDRFLYRSWQHHMDLRERIKWEFHYKLNGIQLNNSVTSYYIYINTLTCTFIALFVTEAIIWTIIVNNAFNSETTNTKIRWVTQMAWWTGTSSSVIENITDSIGITCVFYQAWIRALPINTWERFDTIWVLGTLVRKKTTRFQIGITNRTRWTLTFERSGSVMADRTKMTWCFFTFVNVQASLVCICESASASTMKRQW